jgi:hypothetical protein
VSPQGEEDFGIPTFNGVAFLTGIGADEEFERILTALQLS